MTAPADDDAGLRSLPSGLWSQLRADPARAPEHLALAAAAVHGPAARDWVAERRATYATTPAELARMAKRRHATLARFGGAAGGVGGFVTMLPDLAAAVWIQSRCVYFVAAAYGFDPLDRMRPAEQLVLQRVYDDVGAARGALDGAGRPVVQAMVGNAISGRAGDEALARRLTRMVGRGTVRHFAGRMIPGFAIAFNALANERETRALAERAIVFYGG
jgi:EcsC protein family